MTTINDLAKVTGYSKSTISKALKGNTRISKETREKIQHTAKQLNYVPNSKAVSLSTGKSQTIGVILPYATYNSYYDQILYGIIQEVTQSGWQCLILPTNYDKEIELAHLRSLQSKALDGLIITSRTNSLETIASFSQFGTIVLLNENETAPRIGTVNLSIIEGYRYLLNQYTEQHFQQVGLCISRKLTDSQTSQKIKNLLTSIYPNFSEKLIFEESKTYEDGLKAGDYFAHLPQPPQLILANSDAVAAGILHYYQQSHLNPPLVIGQEHQAISQMLGFPSLDFNLNQAGKIAAQLCLNNKPDHQKIPFIFYQEKRGN